VNIYSPRLADLRAREGTLFSAPAPAPVYIVERDPNFVHWRRWILSADAFNYYGLSGGAIKAWSTATVNSYGNTAHVHPYKSMYVGRWNQQLVCDPIVGYCDYAGWITLREDRNYNPVTCPDCAANWGGAIDGALGTWNNKPTTARFTSQAPSGSNQVHFSANNYPNVTWAGKTDFYNASFQLCAEPPSCAWAAVAVKLNNDMPPAGSRQITTEHELGHAIVLAHDGMDNDNRDSLCGAPRAPRTVMDYDCEDQMNGVQTWDSCGVNHAYYDPNWGWNGC